MQVMTEQAKELSEATIKAMTDSLKKGGPSVTGANFRASGGVKGSKI